MLFNVHKQHTYALKKDTFISVSIEMPKNVKKATHKRVVKTAPVVKSAQTNVKKNIDVNDLFSDVWTPKVTTKKRKVNSKRLQDIAKKIKTVDSSKTDNSSEKKLQEKISKDDKKNQQLSTAREVNEYLAKIQAIVYQHFHVPPNSEGNSVKSVIELDPLGRMTDFRILEYSSNAALNSEVDKIKERLKDVVFPANPEGKSSRTIVVLISKE